MNYIATVISNLSNGYIHLYWTDPSTFASNSKCMGRCSIESKKRSLHSFVSVNALLFSMRAPTRNHSISWKIIDSPNQSHPHNKILFPRYIISQSSGGPQLCQLINQQSKKNIYIPVRTTQTRYHRR